ncbi:hypothetical protein FWK35_00006259, partial [Aphis craccivora]
NHKTSINRIIGIRYLVTTTYMVITAFQVETTYLVITAYQFATHTK